MKGMEPDNGSCGPTLATIALQQHLGDRSSQPLEILRLRHEGTSRYAVQVEPQEPFAGGVDDHGDLGVEPRDLPGRVQATEPWHAEVQDYDARRCGVAEVQGLEAAAGRQNAVAALAFWARMASLHALEQTRRYSFWKRWLGQASPSADTIGRVCAQLELPGLREVLYGLYSRFRRNKVLARSHGESISLIIDGHESSASYRRHCPGCLQRKITIGGQEHVQYYHRSVMAQLQVGEVSFLLDMEPQLPHEDEVAAALRLFLRVAARLPRAFDIVLVDGLYARAEFFRTAIERGKDVVAVLKDDRRDLLQDALSLFAAIPPIREQEGSTERLMWDLDGFTSWEAMKRPVRVVRSLETTTWHAQANGCLQTRVADWVWVTTLSPSRVATPRLVALAHRRWAIENEGFNELVEHWHADHLFHHHPKAVQVFWLMVMMAHNLFHAFVSRQIKPALRVRHTCLHWASLIAADLHHCAPVEPWPLPP